jgi:hypothetical protein
MLHILDWLDVSEAWGYFDEDGVGPAYLLDFQGPNPSGTQFETRELEVVVLCVEQNEVSSLEFYNSRFPFSLVRGPGLALLDMIPCSTDQIVKVQDEVINCRASTGLGQGDWHSGLSAMTKEEWSIP